MPVIAVGYSAGGSLVFSYGGDARRWRLPVSSAMMSISAGRVPGAALPRLPCVVRVRIQVGEPDDVAGSGGAAAFLALAGWAYHEQAPLRGRHVRPGFVADHATPKLDSRAARQAFRYPLDALIAEARLGPAPAHR